MKTGWAKVKILIKIIARAILVLSFIEIIILWRLPYSGLTTILIIIIILRFYRFELARYASKLL